MSDLVVTTTPSYFRFLTYFRLDTLSVNLWPLFKVSDPHVPVLQIFDDAQIYAYCRENSNWKTRALRFSKLLSLWY